MAKRTLPKRDEVEMETPVVQEKAKQPEVSKKVVVVNCESLRVREAPSTSAKIFTTVKVGTELEVDSIADKWLKIKIPKQTVFGYVARVYTREV